MSCYMLTAIVVICWLYCTGEVYPRTGSGEDEDSGWRPQAGHRRGPGARRTIVETGNTLTSIQANGDRGRCGWWVVAWLIVKKDQWSSIVAGKQSQVKESIVPLEMILLDNGIDINTRGYDNIAFLNKITS